LYRATNCVKGATQGQSPKNWTSDNRVVPDIGDYLRKKRRQWGDSGERVEVQRVRRNEKNFEDLWTFKATEKVDGAEENQLGGRVMGFNPKLGCRSFWVAKERMNEGRNCEGEKRRQGPGKMKERGKS